MYSQKFKDVIEYFSMNLIDLDEKNNQDMASLLVQVDFLKTEIKQHNNASLTKLLDSIGNLIEKLILIDIDPIDDIDNVYNTIIVNFENFKKIIESSTDTINIPENIQTQINNINIQETQKEEFQFEQADDDIFSDFLNEAREYVVLLENHMLELEKYPDNLNLINEIFRPFHTLKGVSGFMGLKKINYLSHEAENILDKARNGKIKINNNISTLIFKAIDLIKKIISGLDIDNRVENAGDEEINTLVMHLKNITNESSSSQEMFSENNVEGIALTRENKETQEINIKNSEDSIRVKVEKLDSLIDMVGELVITFNLLHQDKYIMKIIDHNFIKKMSQLQRVISDLQKVSMSLRMIPIGSTFNKMKRVVRDYLSKHQNKAIELNILGEDTEIDKNMVESINEPLVHMIRNACDHGIETTEERLQNNKSEKGTITLSAYHKGNSIIIDVKDDGKGLNKEKIKQKAIEKKLILSGQVLSDSEIFKLVFLPGFSTMEKVSNVSGRGVGMDVVMQSINHLGGSVEIYSNPNEGSTFRIILPLTLAIIEGMLVKIETELYLIPIANIKRSIKPTKDNLNSVMGKGDTIKIEDKLIPIIRLNRKFKISKQDESLENSLLIVLETGEKQFAVAVDELIGIQSVVVKTLGEKFKNLEGVSGATIMGDGRVGLILDVSKLDIE